jgi:hypothetical protein
MKTHHLINTSYLFRTSKPVLLLNRTKPGILKACFFLFYILFLAAVTKAQNTVSVLNTKNTPLLAVATPINSNNTYPLSASTDNNISMLVPKKTTTTKDTFSFMNNNEQKAKAMVNAYFQGIDDADDHYTAKKSGKGLIIATTIIGTPLLGLIPAIACSAKTPGNKNLNIPKSSVVGNDAYIRGYRSEAHYIKKHNTWPCYVLAGILWAGVAGLILR